MELKDRLKYARKKAGLTQVELAERAGIKQASVSEIERGLSKSSGHLVRLAQVCGVDPVWLSEGTKFPGHQWASTVGGFQAKIIPEDFQKVIESSPAQLGAIETWDDETPLHDDEVYVPFLQEVELAAGTGRFAIEESDTARLRFFKKDLRQNGVQFNNAKCVAVSGSSMQPVLRDGATVGVNTAKSAFTDIVNGEMYAISHDGQLRIKQVFRLPTGLRLRSFNRDEYPDEDYTFAELQEQQISIIGHVFWWAMYSR
ncbi:helix-turn-helix transcriptional regulator [Pseudomonas sp. MSSRFD41]|uniref:XRE family transcriptional regulator n=1 Tax=Pseudomonas sp. MSSRFD41 TaxID=1310370 RepID=UPI00163A1B92|nr:helix-turn-helix transcriptional regulator [Pseudomonas sp. MSSRFD41]MBC2655064.1 helix-turn-helix transcriptional regulator [Pseudomonas sp. MSSRFD41]